MPLTDFQRQIMRLLAENRSRSAYLAGGSISSMDGARFGGLMPFALDDSMPGGPP